ncbi:MAG: glycerol-3-phosphate acyltransferase, partial [Woeseia sp.]
WAERRNIQLTSDFDIENTDHLRTIVDIMIKIGPITRYAEGPLKVYGIAPEQQLQASYYRNTVIHYFINKAISELALAKAGEASAESATDVFWAEAERVRDLFKFEFFYSPLLEFREELKFELCDVHDDWEPVLAAGGAAVKQMLAAMQPLVAHATLLHFIEAYSVVADLLGRCPANEVFDERVCVARATRYARQLFLQRRISSEASISELLFRNAYKLIKNQNLTAVGGAALAAGRNSIALELRDLLARLHRIGALAVAARGQKLGQAHNQESPIAQASNQ